MNKSTENTEEIRKYFDQLNLYKKIVDHNYMAHREIYAEMKKFLHNSSARNFTLCDAGCGDASSISKILHGSRISKYIGIDLSPFALEKANENISSLNCDAEFLEGDIINYLAQLKKQSIDIFVAGFSVHHFQDQEKRFFFEQCHRILTSTGYLLFCDVFRRSSESRDDYLHHYFTNSDAYWTALPEPEIKALKKHVTSYDFPTNIEEITEIASNAGFRKNPILLFSDSPGFHRLYVFSA
ncbi:MAG: methyltransferase domain-containing protein [Gammaproteobacteria bacterium]|nr:methyltransferase domain-containing protein [Gammaproteobacteria bacterium]NIN61384.1 methyltransferase domain-containing protein [Gammaproteobacteria bacterium]NIO61151.1 methyltransferase domain-containing protein [Gammaproteobacteria bacterium]NIQ19153.1 methyltransferase domain-containing protein [Gammaproteobacteria bacterium]NIT05213.1 methyltransferase domain-containing protein [Gammaproteobacteria bacterium]